MKFRIYIILPESDEDERASKETETRPIQREMRAKERKIEKTFKFRDTKTDFIIFIIISKRMK